MSEDNSNNQYLKLREVFKETLLRDAIIFLVFYLFILAQNWQNLFLLFFPIVSFGFSLFFRIISVNKYKIYSTDSNLVYNPIGLEEIHANRLNFITLFLLILLFWLGAESIYHPQMIKQYNIYFNVLFSFIYSFGFFWLFIDIWKNSKIATCLPTEKSSTNEEYNIILSRLKYKLVKLLGILNLMLFLCINLVNVILQYLVQIEILYGINVYLPGTGIESSKPLNFPFTIIIILLFFPFFSIISLIIIYRDVTTFHKLELTNFLNTLSDENRIHMIENLKKLNKKIWDNSELK